MLPNEEIEQQQIVEISMDLKKIFFLLFFRVKSSEYAMYSDLYVYRSRKSGECRLFLLLGSLFIPFDVFHRFLFIIIQYIKIKWVYIYSPSPLTTIIHAI